MSSDFDDRLRDARVALPVPDEPATERARRRVLAEVRRKRQRGRVLVLAGSMLLCAVAIAVSAGSLSAPSVTAAREPATLGFVPEPGWFALQSPPPAVEGQQTVAAAANVPFAADDVENGLVEPSGLPYSTLLALPPDGIVIVSTMTPRSAPHVAPVLTNVRYPKQELPLRLTDGIPVVYGGGQVRPEQPMAQYHLGAQLRGYNVDVVVYFGTPRPSAALMREAQAQLDGFVVRPDRAGAVARPTAEKGQAGQRAVLDRTYSCKTVILGGVYEIEARAHAGIRAGAQWSKLPYAVVSSGGWAGTLVGYPYARDNSLAWITAARPTHDTTADVEEENFPVQTGGTLGVNRSLCTPSRATVPLGKAGLRGGAIGTEGSVVDCKGPRRVLVRIRASTRTAASLTPRGAMLVASNSVVRKGELAVRIPAGKRLAYAVVEESGRSRQYSAPRVCTPE